MDADPGHAALGGWLFADAVAAVGAAVAAMARRWPVLLTVPAWEIANAGLKFPDNVEAAAARTSHDCGSQPQRHSNVVDLAVAGFGVAGAGVDEPHGASVVVNEVPDPAAAGHLVLPLFERLTIVRTPDEVIFQPVVAFRRWHRTRCRSDDVEGGASVAWRLAEYFLPALCHIVAGKPQVVLIGSGRWRDPVTSSRAYVWPNTATSGAGTEPWSPSCGRVRTSCSSESA